METTDQTANTLTAALCAFGAVWSQLLDRPLVIDDLSRSTEFSLRGRLPERAIGASVPRLGANWVPELRRK